MKTKNMIWAALSMTAALVMTACTNDDNIVETPAAPQAEVKTIPYTVTVNDGAATNRAAVDSDNKTLRFATGDKLYITGTNVKGVLDITSGVGETTGATFSGDLTVIGGGTVDPDLSLTATLVSAQQTVGTEVSVSESGAVTVNYPTTAYCTDVATAVQKYSWLTGTSTYSAKSFTLSQETAFLNFVITFEDGTTTDTELSAVVSNGGSAIATANVTTTTESEKVVAKFVLPVYSSTTTLSSANVKMGDKAAISFGASQTLTGKVYNVKKTQAAASLITSPAVGQFIGSDGKNYAADATLPAGVTKVAKIFYVGSDNGEAAPYNHGLALAMSDANSGNSCKWSTSTTQVHTYYTSSNSFTSESGLQYNDATHNTDAYPAFKAAIANNGTAAPTGCSAWFLASGYQWKKMADAAGGYNKLGLGSNYYWSSTEYDASGAWSFYPDYDGYWYHGSKDSVSGSLVRSCLAF